MDVTQAEIMSTTEISRIDKEISQSIRNMLEECLKYISVNDFNL